MRRLLALFLLIPLVSSAADSLLSTRNFNGYTIRVYNHGDYYADRYLEIRRGDSLLFRVHGAVSVIDSGAAKFGNDFAGTGEPSAIIESYSGGAHCCFTYYILELGKRFALLDSLPTADAGARFEDLNHDGRVEVITADNTFAYWNAPFAASPFPRVVLKFRHGHLIVAENLMRKPAPSADSLRTLAAEVRADSVWGPYTKESGPFAKLPSALWRVMLDLIYTGHADLAWAFLDEAWPQSISGKDHFLSDFQQQLFKSPYLRALRCLNGKSLTLHETH